MKFYMLFYFIYSVFVPVESGSFLVTAGLALYCAGFVFYSWAWVIIARAKEGAMFTGGPYRYSRHPVYLSSAVMFLGAGFVSNSLFFLGLSLLTGLSHMHNACDEEKICRQVFGKDYEAYSEMTPRWIGAPGKRTL